MKRLVFLLMSIRFTFLFCKYLHLAKNKIIQLVLIHFLTNIWQSGIHGNLDELDAITSENFELRMTPDFEPKIGRDLLKDEITNTRKGFPDFNIKEDKKLFVGDSAVVIHWILTGTNTGKSTMPPTGNKVNVPGFSVIFFADNLITGEWIAFSDLMWVSQLGFTITPPEFIEK